MPEIGSVITAVRVHGSTLVCPDRELPHKRGNCFSVIGEDDRIYHIVNFNHENMEYLNAHGVPFPVGIAVLRDSNRAVIHNHRIPSEWYDSRFCEVCCLQEDLPLPQRLRIAREIRQGVRVKGAGMTMFYFGSGPKIQMPEKK